MKNLFKEQRIPAQGPLKLFCNNKAAINISHNPIHHDRIKHVEVDQVDRHFIKEKVEDGTICIMYVLTSSHVADVLTKSLWKSDFERMIDKLGLFNIYNSA